MKTVTLLICVLVLVSSLPMSPPIRDFSSGNEGNVQLLLPQVGVSKGHNSEVTEEAPPSVVVEVLDRKANVTLSFAIFIIPEEDKGGSGTGGGRGGEATESSDSRDVSDDASDEKVMLKQVSGGLVTDDNNSSPYRMTVTEQPVKPLFDEADDKNNSTESEAMTGNDPKETEFDEVDDKNTGSSSCCGELRRKVANQGKEKKEEEEDEEENEEDVLSDSDHSDNVNSQSNYFSDSLESTEGGKISAYATSIGNQSDTSIEAISFEAGDDASIAKGDVSRASTSLMTNSSTDGDSASKSSNSLSFTSISSDNISMASLSHSSETSDAIDIASISVNSSETSDSVSIGSAERSDSNSEELNYPGVLANSLTAQLMGAISSLSDSVKRVWWVSNSHHGVDPVSSGIKSVGVTIGSDPQPMGSFSNTSGTEENIGSSSEENRGGSTSASAGSEEGQSLASGSQEVDGSMSSLLHSNPASSALGPIRDEPSSSSEEVPPSSTPLLHIALASSEESSEALLFSSVSPRVLEAQPLSPLPPPITSLTPPLSPVSPPVADSSESREYDSPFLTESVGSKSDLNNGTSSESESMSRESESMSHESESLNPQYDSMESKVNHISTQTDSPSKHPILESTESVSVSIGTSESESPKNRDLDSNESFSDNESVSMGVSSESESLADSGFDSVPTESFPSELTVVPTVGPTSGPALSFSQETHPDTHIEATQEVSIEANLSISPSPSNCVSVSHRETSETQDESASMESGINHSREARPSVATNTYPTVEAAVEANSDANFDANIKSIEVSVEADPHASVSPSVDVYPEASSEESLASPPPPSSNLPPPPPPPRRPLRPYNFGFLRPINRNYGNAGRRHVPVATTASQPGASSSPARERLVLRHHQRATQRHDRQEGKKYNTFQQSDNLNPYTDQRTQDLHGDLHHRAKVTEPEQSSSEESR